MKKKDTAVVAPNPIGDAAARVHATIDRASAAAVPALEWAGSRAHQATDKLAAAADAAAVQLEIKGRALRDTQSRLTENCRAQIQEKPLIMLGIGVAAGFLLSWLLRQRSASRSMPE